MVVGARPRETDQVRTGAVAGSQPVHLGQDVGFRQACRHVEPAGEAQGRRHDFEELVQRGQADVGQHGGQFGVGMGDVVAH